MTDIVGIGFGFLYVYPDESEWQDRQYRILFEGYRDMIMRRLRSRA